MMKAFSSLWFGRFRDPRLTTAPSTTQPQNRCFFCLCQRLPKSRSNMKPLPGVERAVLEPAKVRDYLLSPTHPVGRFKAAFFIALGYSSSHWELLRDDILAIALTGAATSGSSNGYGQVFEVDGILISPTGRTAAVRTAWIIRNGEQFPRLVTAFPR